MSSTRRLTLTIHGELARSGRVALSELARLAGEFQGSLERLAVLITRSGHTRGRRPSEIVDAVRLDLVSLGEGSAVLDLVPHAEQQLLLYEPVTLLEQALQALSDGLDQLVRDPMSTPPAFDHAVISGLAELTGSIGNGIVDIQLDTGNGAPLRIDARVKQAVRAARRRYVDAQRRVIGRLEMGDFAPSALRCRIDTADGSFLCDFDASMRDEVLAAMDRLVVAEGAAETWTHTGRVRLLHLERIEVVDEARSKTLDELIVEQGVRSIGDPAALAGGFIDDFDEFLNAIRAARGAK